MTTEEALQKTPKDNAKRSDQFYGRSQEAVVQYSSLAMRAPAILSAGSIAALLAFYSANSLQLGKSISIFNAILTDLMLALIISSVTTLVAYFAQYCISLSIARKEYYRKNPIHSAERDANFWITLGRIFHITAIAMLIVSYVFIFMAGNNFILLLAQAN